MGITISKPPINLREQLTELKAQQGYEERQFHFDGLVTNGTFDTDTDWIKPTDGSVTIAGGVASASSTTAGQNVLRQDFALITNTTYAVTFTVSNYSAGLVAPNILGFPGAGTYVSADGTYTQYLNSGATPTGLSLISGTTLTCDIDNISVYEVDPADNKVIHTMPKGWKPLHVFEDGALQREGSAYDYTVEYDGFNYIVKETVVPVAPYSTTVIGVRA